MPETFVSGLDDQTRHKIKELLNARLADMSALTLAVNKPIGTSKAPAISACTSCSMMC